ncbi:hypothetical protein E2C01_079247 [Portunus trituberculatus]|uniref:Uncharacterized protein n=1 Tax=Portunus trituberculatus TaxID=210409 RepID=A0A5B7IV29_PORTR|nr:hypothetical protein [Portunus trituberculatus]
MAWGESMPSR